MPKENRLLNPQGLYEKVTKGKAIAYTPEFKTWLAEHEGAIGTTLSIIKEIEVEVSSSSPEAIREMEHWTWANEEEKKLGPNPSLIGKIFEKNGVRVSLEILKDSFIYKVQTKNKVFFLKKEDRARNLPNTVGGFYEINTSARVADILKGEEGVRVVDFNIGYTDSVRKNRYFVARWESNYIALNTYLSKINRTDEYGHIIGKIKKLKDILRANKVYLFDFDEYNMFYDPLKKEIVLFDLNTLKDLQNA